MFLYKITKKGGYVSVKAKKVLKIILIILLVAVLIVGGYVAYVMIDYHRIEDNQALQINDVTSESALVDQEYKAISYNIGFAAYTPDFGFFMDGGTKSRANSEESVKSVIDGIGDFLKSENPDIILVEEVDKKATRSYHYDQEKALRGKLDGYDSMFTVNFDSPYLFYPITKPHGKSYAGMLILSKFNIESGLRRSLPIENGFMKFVDLDRCYSVSRITVENGKELVLYTLHLSAYTSDGTIATDQLKMLISDMQAAISTRTCLAIRARFSELTAQIILGRNLLIQNCLMEQISKLLLLTMRKIRFLHAEMPTVRITTSSLYLRLTDL